MEPILLATALVAFCIFGLTFFFLAKEIRSRLFDSKEKPLIVLALSYLVFSIILCLWSFNFLEFKSQDLLLVLSVILVVKIFIQYKLGQNKKVFYFLYPLLMIIPLSFFLPNLTHIMIPISLFIILSTFLSTTSLHENPVRYMVAYTSVSLFLYLLQSLFQNIAKISALVSTLLFLFFIVAFLKFLRNHKQQNMFLTKFPESPLIQFLKHIIFIIIITNFIFIGTVAIHEFGHLVASSGSDCRETKIVYELEGLPHTQVNCQDTSDKGKWILGGVLLPIIVAAFLFFSGGKFIKELALQIVGFNLTISYLDLKALGFSEALSTFVLISGAALVVFSLALLIKTRVE